MVTFVVLTVKSSAFTVACASWLAARSSSTWSRTLCTTLRVATSSWYCFVAPVESESALLSWYASSATARKSPTENPKDIAPALAVAVSRRKQCQEIRGIISKLLKSKLPAGGLPLRGKCRLRHAESLHSTPHKQALHGHSHTTTLSTRALALMCTISVRILRLLFITQTETFHKRQRPLGVLPRMRLHHYQLQRDRVLEAGLYSCAIPVLRTVYGPRSVSPCRAVLFHRISFRSSHSVVLTGLAVSSSVNTYSLWYLPSLRHRGVHRNCQDFTRLD